MAIAISTFEINDVNSQNLTINKPSGVVQGDLMIAQLVKSNNAYTMSLAGWTLIQDGSPASGGPYMGTFYKVAGASEPASYTFVGTGSSPTAGGIIRITGAKVIDTSSERYNDTASTTATGNTITPTYSNSYLLFFVGNVAGTTSEYAIATNNPSWTELWETSRTGVYCSFAYGSRPETTATGSATATLSSSSRSAVHLIAVKEAPEFTISETTTLTETKTFNISILKEEILSLIETYTYSIARLWTKITKPITTWVNKNKNG